MTNEEALQHLLENACNKCMRVRCGLGCQKDDCTTYNYRKALERIIPQNPICGKNKVTDNKCPSCNARLKSGRGSSSFYRNNFCNHCGQAINWSEYEHDE